MRTLVVKTLEKVTGYFPKVDKYNIRMNKQGNGSGTLTVNISSSTGPHNLLIAGGKFIVSESEVDTVQISTAVQQFVIKLYSEQAYLYFPQNVNIELRPTWDLVTKNSPEIDFRTFNRNFKTLNAQFSNATLFNQNISNWDVSSITDLTLFLNNAISFNANISNWDVSNVTVFSNTFLKASFFNQPIGSWNVSKATNMNSMLRESSLFNQSLSNWNVEKVTDMSNMFYLAVSFNSSIAGWNTLSLTNMNSMFRGAKVFNQSINHLKTGKVINMLGTFRESRDFNQDISSWDVSKVTNMSFMFYDANAFNQDISAWNFNVNVDLSSFMATKGVEYNPAYYSNLLIKLASIDWTVRSTPKVLSMGTIRYNSAGASARATLVSNGWTITDGGQS
ncbi:BspA family leucine-rich repeat surface protein [Sphingobacterium faecium]|uniref:BspA family leucine-rich repeat surface protein n=1 Tax=Sphingobacterium faecium TaxID=34087 RepID=UPI00246859C4|nr:BspA family leucine-rich repeat surface protein [Sphingobacterium faecium]MDH5825776.1 BspA family leucine-rich repeat surface protein [Sphingobacterium faecium]